VLVVRAHLEKVLIQTEINTESSRMQEVYNKERYAPRDGGGVAEGDVGFRLILIIHRGQGRTPNRRELPK